MNRNRPHKNLIAWQRAMQLVLKVYSLTREFPKEEEYGLSVQLRRAAVSVPSNIAEGLTRSGRKDRFHFLNISQSSLSEIDTQIDIALGLHYIDGPAYDEIQGQIAEVGRLLSGLSRSLR